jgi:hypothetical protein
MFRLQWKWSETFRSVCGIWAECGERQYWHDRDLRLGLRVDRHNI